ncbi:hypothetical protein ABZX92_18180 [Lentzea sp. NPDC006480]|uniref:hypothetical protein n=1 Tax=Lentzea sp. NPDC006480 TaxID=3157176 RepID=UPI00339FE541
MSDWGRFVECVPWFVSPGSEVVVGSTSVWTRGALPGLPRLSALLASARVTPVSVAGRPYELLSWGSSGWLCEPPSEGDSSHPDSLRAFWRVFGGTVEQFHGPSTLWLNQNQVLTVDAASLSLSSVISEYGWLWTDAGLEVPVEEMRDYVTVAIEANGNLTAAHRETGRLVLFAPDHSFSDVTPLAGCPPRSLYSFDELPDLASWIESCAGAWQGALS